MEKENKTFYSKDQLVPVPDGMKRMAYEDVDALYDLIGVNGFHGRSCDRWAPHFYDEVPLSNQEGNDILRKD